jgi:hypothetical protein
MPQVQPKLTKQSEERILDALEQVRGLLSEGMHPNDALVKVATERKIPAGHIQIMVNAVNVGRTNEQRMSADDLFKKAEEFPLANAHTILSRLYPDQVKSAAVVYTETVVSADYNRSPLPLVKAAQVIEKRAFVLPPLTDKKPVSTPCYSDLPEVRMRKALAICKQAEFAANDARRNAQVAYDNCIKLAADLVDYFRRPGSISFGEVRYNATSLFGKKASLLLDLVANRLSKELREKQAYKTLVPVDINNAPYSLIHESIKAGKTYLTKKAAYEKAVVDGTEAAGTALRPFELTPSQGRSVLAGLCSRTEELEKDAANPFTSFLGSGFGLIGGQRALSGIASKFPGATRDPDSDDREDLRNLLDPAHEAEIRNIQAEAMLNDLMANDDIIRRHDPQEVLDAYNEVSQLSPHSGTQKAVMREAIRSRLGGGADAFDRFALDHLTNTEDKLKNQKKLDGADLDVMKTIGGLPKGGDGGEKKSSVLD